MASHPDLIETIIKLIVFGKETRERYKIYTRAKVDLSELNTFLQASLSILEAFRKVMARSIDSLLHRQQQEIASLVDHLQGVFDRLDKQLSRFPRDSKLNIMGKLRWTFKGKRGYEAIILEMAEWRSDMQSVVEAIKLLREEEKEEDHSLYKQLFECGGAGICCADQIDMLRRGVYVSRSLPPIKDALGQSLRMSGNLWDGNRLILKGHLTFVECRYHEALSPEGMKQSIADVNNLASLLHHVDAPSMHILRCKGTEYQAEGYRRRSLMFYEIPCNEPTNSSKWTLAQAIEDKCALMPPLNTRVRYAVEISMAVMFTHAAGLVHKSICPENVLILRNSPGDNVRHEFSPYVVGFHASRLCESPPLDASASVPRPMPARIPETDTLKRLYKHPERQMLLQNGRLMRFRIHHEMYSLGVVLLELAMWSRIKDTNDLNLRKLIYAVRYDFDPWKLQTGLTKLVEQYIVGLAGKKYAKVVLCCLQNTIADQRSERKMRELFYERVLRPLKEIII